MTTQAEQQFYTKLRTAVGDMLAAFAAAESLIPEWNALDYTNTLDVGTGVHEGLTKTQLVDVVGTTLPAIRTLLNAGHGTNLYRISY